MISRVYKGKDQNKLIEVIDSVCAGCEWMTTKKFIPTVQWEHSLSAPNCQAHVLFVVEEKNDVVGWCRIFPENCQVSLSNVELGIGLLPVYRNKKWGHKILEIAFSWALKKELKQINLTVNEGNKIAFHLFNKFGFVVENKENDTYFMTARI